MFIVREAVVNEDTGSTRFFRVRALPYAYETYALASKMLCRLAEKMEAEGGWSDGLEVFNTVRRCPAYAVTTWTPVGEDDEIPF